jgi:hypothetical protein
MTSIIKGDSLGIELNNQLLCLHICWCLKQYVFLLILLNRTGDLYLKKVTGNSRLLIPPLS